MKLKMLVIRKYFNQVILI